MNEFVGKVDTWSKVRFNSAGHRVCILPREAVFPSNGGCDRGPDDSDLAVRILLLFASPSGSVYGET